MARVNLKILNWESEHFGYPCAELQLKSGELPPKELDSQPYSLIVIRSNSPLEGHASLLVDEKVTYAKEIREFQFQNDGEEITRKKASPSLLALTFEAGKDSRFLKDQNFSNGEFQTLYSKWLENSLNGEMANAVYVTGTYSRPSGMITLKYSGDQGIIGLIAVDPQRQGQGLGKKLMAWCEFKCLKEGVRNLKVSTQRSNTQACNFYQKCGFQLSTNEYIYHWWNK